MYSDTKQRPDLSGIVATGDQVAAQFTGLEWVRQQCITGLAIDPYPGTLNLVLDDVQMNSTWQQMKAQAGLSLNNPDPQQCNAIYHPVRLNESVYAAIVIPQIENYPDSKIEIIASIPLRQTLGLSDGDHVDINFVQPRDCTTLIMDLDGTLVDTIDAFYELACSAAAQIDIEIHRDEVLESLNYGTPFWQTVFQARGVSDWQAVAQQLTQKSHALWPDVIRQHGKLRPSVVETIRQLKNDGFRLAIYTGSRGESLELLLSSGVGECFDVVLSTTDVANKKPHPEGLNVCMEKLNVSAGECIYIGDTVVDVLTAKAAGMAAIGVLSGAGSSAQLSEAGAHHLITGIEHLSWAVKIQ